jgi:hypothetical protein
VLLAKGSPMLSLTLSLLLLPPPPLLLLLPPPLLLGTEGAHATRQGRPSAVKRMHIIGSSGPQWQWRLQCLRQWLPGCHWQRGAEWGSNGCGWGG